ncbi:MAG: response regulator [Lachnospiraceae bacterium]|nr:response regulator [Lachnospiraceae bacterium]
MKVLLIEDEAVIRSGILRHIRWNELGVDEIRSASNGAEALALRQEYEPDIIISDIRMPGMIGTDLMREFRKLQPECQVIFISGYSDKEFLTSAISLGAVAYVEKPIDLTILSDAIRMAVENVQKAERAHKAESILSEMESDPAMQDYIRQHTQESGENESDTQSLKIRAACSFIDEHLTEKDLTLSRLAQEVDLSPSYLSSLFARDTGMTLKQYITEARMKKAAALLRNPELKQYEVAMQVGYDDAKYFARVFRETTGMSPSEYRARL